GGGRGEEGGGGGEAGGDPRGRGVGRGGGGGGGAERVGPADAALAGHPVEQDIERLECKDEEVRDQVGQQRGPAASDEKAEWKRDENGEGEVHRSSRVVTIDASRHCLVEPSGSPTARPVP